MPRKATRENRRRAASNRVVLGWEGGRKPRLHLDLRNEANLWARLLIWRGLRWGRGWRGIGSGGLGLFQLLGLVGGLEALEFLEGAVVVAADRIDAALEAIEHAVGEVEDPAVGMLIRGVSALRILGLVFPEFRLAAAEPAQQPVAVDQGIDQQAALGRGCGETLLICGDEIFELVRIFAGDDLGFGVNAGFQGIEAGRGLALGGAWAGGFLGVLTIRLGLFVCGHVSWFEGSRGQVGDGWLGICKWFGFSWMWI